MRRLLPRKPCRQPCRLWVERRDKGMLGAAKIPVVKFRPEEPGLSAETEFLCPLSGAQRRSRSTEPGVNRGSARTLRTTAALYRTASVPSMVRGHGRHRRFRGVGGTLPPPDADRGRCRLAGLFVFAVRTLTDEMAGAARARSAVEAFLFRLLETIPGTAGRFVLNGSLPIAFGDRDTMEVNLLCERAKAAVEIDGAQHLGMRRPTAATG